MGMGAERRKDVGSVVLAEMDWRGTRDVCMADGEGNGQEAVVGTGKVAGGVVAGGIWRADLEARRGYHSLQVPSPPQSENLLPEDHR